MSLLTFLTRRQETPMPTETVQQPAEQPAAWPEGVIARYLTVGGATVDLTGGGNRTYCRCTGCNFGEGNWWNERTAHKYAQSHAETCRAMPRPTA